MRAFVQRHSKLILLAGLWVCLAAGFAEVAPAILQPEMATTVLRFSTILALVSLGQALVVVGGGAGIDLSVGSVMSLTGILAMTLVGRVAGGALIPVACVVVGGALGVVNGALVTRTRLPPLIATLGTLFAFGGTAVALTGGASLPGVPAWLLPLGRGSYGGIPLDFALLVLPAYAVAALLLSQSPAGRWIYAMGWNEASARLVGIKVDRIRFLLYCGSGVTSGLASLAALSWFGSARPNIGLNLELESLAAILVGGISIDGGSGRLIGVLAAVTLIETLKAGLQFVNVNVIWQLGIVGALVLLVMVADRLGPRART